MSESAPNLAKENAQLRSKLAKLEAQFTATTSRLERNNAYLTERLNLLLAQRYGASSERHDEGQLALFDEAESPLEEPVPVADAPVQAHRRRKGAKRALPAEFERVDVRHELSDDERVCPTDGTVLDVIGEETSEQLDIIPAKVRVLRHIQVKYACPCCQNQVVTAPKPKMPIPGSQASPGLLAHVAVSKYLDHLPLYRQGAVFERMGLITHRSTMSQWMVKCGELVQPLINLLGERLLEQSLVQMDETTVQVLKEPGKSAESQSYMWVRVAGSSDRPVILFDYDPSRSAQVPRRLLEGFNGLLQVDGYAGYDAAIAQYGLIPAGCWAHARRRFDEVFKAAGLNPKKPIPKDKPPPAPVRRAARALQWMKTLFAIEHRIRERPPDERRAVRQAESAPVCLALRQWLDETRPTVTPKSKLGEALTYLDNQWPRLNTFLEHGELEMTNNAAENAIRPFALGRKNWLFSQSQNGARASANLYSLLQTAKANRLEPHGYLKIVLTSLPNCESVEDIEALLPWNLTTADTFETLT